MKTWSACLWVGLGGFLGANARFLLGRLVALQIETNFPLGTFVINVTGSFALGLLAGFLQLRSIPLADQLRLTFAVGFIGAYTTFSTYELESSGLIDTGRWGLAALNLFGSLAAGLIAVRLGVILARAWA